MSKITKVRIHPAIGIARLGNADNNDTSDNSERDDFYIGPQYPNMVEVPTGGYKKSGKIRRQAAEFRLYGFDENDQLVQEITNEHATIKWTVKLANKKASWRKFSGLNATASFRNDHILMDDTDGRNGLNIEPSEKTIQGGDTLTAYFDDAEFADYDDNGNVVSEENVCLGEMLTDKLGRLLVLSGKGKSKSPTGTDIVDYANNPGWYDDTSDGRVDASILFNDGSSPDEVIGSWVICTLPKFAPQLPNIVTLYDVLTDVAVKNKFLSAPSRPQFYRDIVPILQRMYAFQWLLGIGGLHDAIFEDLMDPSAGRNRREDLFVRLRSPRSSENRSRMNMPKLLDDNNSWTDQGPGGFHLTSTQYGVMKKWFKGSFAIDDPPDDTSEPRVVTPHGLDQAALENCCGGAFYPGMEVGWFMRDVFRYSEPFRLDRKQPRTDSGVLEPGDVTKQMAVPWQADFFACTARRYAPAWWPQQRPDFVIDPSSGDVASWTRNKVSTYQAMVERWSELGFVIRDGDRYVEKERNP